MESRQKIIRQSNNLPVFAKYESIKFFWVLVLKFFKLYPTESVKAPPNPRIVWYFIFEFISIETNGFSNKSFVVGVVLFSKIN